MDEKDLDETRRLLYMALAAGRTDKYNLVGTLTNALAHHSGLVKIGDAYDTITKLVEIVEAKSLNEQQVAWTASTIGTLTGLLDLNDAPQG